MPWEKSKKRLLKHFPKSKDLMPTHLGFSLSLSFEEWDERSEWWALLSSCGE